jgi:hypothetical protein
VVLVWALDIEIAAHGLASPAALLRRLGSMSSKRSLAHDAHPPEDHDDTVEAHYACLERPCACIDGWVFLGRVVESEHDLDGEVVEYERVPCRCCADSPTP